MTAEHVTATRNAYDAVAVHYAEVFAGELAQRPLDRAMLDAFAELVVAGPDGPPGNTAALRAVADVGCGPGWVTARLHSRGLAVLGLDVSPGMLALARRAYPELRFEEAPCSALGVPDGALGGIVARYSLIHTPPAELPQVLAEFHRALAPGGRLLVAFQADPDGPPGERPAAPTPFDHKVAPAYRWSADAFAAELRRSGFAETARLVREPRPDERFLQACLLARRSA